MKNSSILTGWFDKGNSCKDNCIANWIMEHEQEMIDAADYIFQNPELAYKETGKPFMGITGTNGKTTVTALTSHILSSEYKAPVCGNIGVPPTSLLDEEIDYFVCELSSFQMEHTNAFKAQIACWTNFTPDHITWHGTLENYFNAKAKLFKNPTASRFAILNGVTESGTKLLSSKVKSSSSPNSL